MPKDDAYKEATGCRSCRYGIVHTKRGLFALSDEGVGPSDPITAKNKLAVDFWAEAKEPDGYIEVWGYPALVSYLDDKDLLELETTETVNLGDFIRWFDWRLDGKYDTWRILLEEASK